MELYFCASGVGISPDYGVYSSNCCFSAIICSDSQEKRCLTYTRHISPLITTNCAILAVTFFGVDYNYNLQVVVYSIGVALGFIEIASVAFSWNQGKLEIFLKFRSFTRVIP